MRKVIVGTPPAWKMASIVRQRVCKCAYLYESVSDGDESKQPRNRRKRIGKVDLKSRCDVHDDWVLARLKAEGEPLPLGVKVLKEDHGLQCRADEVAAALDTVRSDEIYGCWRRLGDRSRSCRC